jgi:molybdate transport system regulatory protein
VTAPRLRVLLGSAIAMGPGKADLLEAIETEGSITRAARRMGMSYRRAWLLVEAMNGCFKAPLVETARGGRRGGGAVLTPLGRNALARYRAMEAKAAATLETDMAAFRKLLSPASRKSAR